MTGPRSFLSHAPEETEALGEALGRVLEAGAVVALSGELGAGKTAFVRGLARGLEVEGAASSPTFTLMQEHAGRLPLYHFDAWMAGREASFLEGGGADYLGGEGVCAVEWAERIEDYLPEDRLEVRLSHRTPTERLLVLEARGGASQRALAALEPPPGPRETPPEEHARGSSPESGEPRGSAPVQERP